MKTITTLLIASAAAISLNASASTYLGVNAEDEYNANSFNHFPTVIQSNTDSEVSLNENEYQYGEVKFEQNMASVLNEMENNPPAAGQITSNNTSILGSHADEEYKYQ
jgi:hypothetical protein